MTSSSQTPRGKGVVGAIRRPALIAISVGVIVLVGFGWLTWQRMSGQRHMGAFPPPAVESVIAKVRPVQVEVSAIGTLEADQSIVVTPEISGIVTTIDFEDGQRLDRGDLIVTLNDEDLKARVQQAEAQLTLSKANFERARKLVSRGSGTERSRDEALNALKSAEAELALAKAQLDKGTIKAAFSGIVGLRQVSLGQYVTPGQPIATLADVDNLRIDFRVSEIYLTEIGKGQTVDITFDALPGETFRGTVSAIDPVIDVDGRALKVRAVIDNKEGRLRPGLFGRVQIVTQTRNSIVVPEQAVISTAGADATGAKAVFVVDEKGFAHMRPVELGVRQPGQVEIRSGVSEGERVITAGQLKVRDGAPVHPIEVKDEASGNASADTTAPGSSAPDGAAR